MEGHEGRWSSSPLSNIRMEVASKYGMISQVVQHPSSAGRVRHRPKGVIRVFCTTTLHRAQLWRIKRLIQALQRQMQQCGNPADGAQAMM